MSPQGYRIMTEKYLKERGYCCGNGCKHCPYYPKATKGNPIFAKYSCFKISFIYSSSVSMQGKDLRIVFMGTPDFAVASLKAFLENGYQVVGVVTAPDKPAGRGQKIQQSAVKLFAIEHPSGTSA